MGENWCIAEVTPSCTEKVGLETKFTIHRAKLCKNATNPLVDAQRCNWHYPIYFVSIIMEIAEKQEMAENASGEADVLPLSISRPFKFCSASEPDVRTAPAGNDGSWRICAA